MGLMEANQLLRIMRVIMNYRDWGMVPMKSNLTKKVMEYIRRPGIQVFGNDTLIISDRFI